MEWANRGADHFGTVLLPGLPLQFSTQIILSLFSLCTCYHHTLFSPSSMQIVCSCFLQASSSGVMVFRVRELKTCICPLWGSYKVLLCGLEQTLTYQSPAFNFQMYLRGTVRPSITWTKQWTTWCLRKCWSFTNKFLRVLWPIRDSKLLSFWKQTYT